MNYITDYQLDIKKGFQCRVNGKTFYCSFAWSDSKKLYYVSHLLRVADAMEIPRQEFIGIFNSDFANDVLYCKSEQECYNLCQIIVKTYFKPGEIGKDIISFRCGNESYKFELKSLSEKYVWENTTDKLKRIVNRSQVNLKKLREELNIKIYVLEHLDYLGFDSREDALKFAKWAKEHVYAKEVCEKFKKNLIKYSTYNETYITKKEKTYDTNRLRKERTSLSRGAKPTGSIIHGRRSKASVRCRHLEHKARIGC